MDDPFRLEARLGPLYPAVAALPPELRRRVLATQALHLQVPAGTPLFEEGSPCQGFPMLLSGEVRVARGSQGEIGRAHV